MDKETTNSHIDVAKAKIEQVQRNLSDIKSDDKDVVRLGTCVIFLRTALEELVCVYDSIESRFKEAKRNVPQSLS